MAKDGIITMTYEQKHRQPFWINDALKWEVDTPPIQLTKNITVDVCIIGGGYTGLWTAIQLKQQKPEMGVVIIEKNLCGDGASGRNGGCMLTWSAKYSSMVRLYGLEEAKRLVTASEQALFKIRDFCLANKIDAEIRLDGALFGSTNEAQLGNMDSVIKKLKQDGINSWEYWQKDKAQLAAGSTRHLEGYHSPIGGSLHPGLLVRGLRKVAINMGVEIFENTPMTALAETSPAIISTPNARITAKKIVLALNAWMPKNFPKFNNKIILVSSDMAITEPIPKLLQEIGIKDGKSILDSRTFVNYYHSTISGRLMLGKGGNMFAFNNIIHPAFDKKSRYEPQLRNTMDWLFPKLKDVSIATTWTGPSDRSATGLPFFGHLNGNNDIVYGLGYSGNGVGQTYVGGQFLSAMVLDLDNEWTNSTMAKGPLGSFPPEPIRWLGAMTVRNAIRRKEKAEDLNKSPNWVDMQLAKIANSAGKSDKN